MTMKLAFSAGFESYGTRFLLRSNDRDILDEVIEIASSALLGNLEPCLDGPYPLKFDLVGPRELYDVIRNGEVITKGTPDAYSARHLNGLIRISVAEFSRDRVFLHAGAVAWRGKGIVLPALSFNGKSTLVYELVKLGAEYYSDDFAILDERGRLNPFPRDISMRTREENYTIYQVDPAEIGGIKGARPVPVHMIFLTKYRPRARWMPKTLLRGQGVFEILPFTLPIRQSPDLAFKTLNSVAMKAIISKSDRGEAKAFARRLLEFVDKTSN
jgi:hypothetical protein